MTLGEDIPGGKDLTSDLLRLAVDTMLCGVIITDAKQPDDPIVYVNRTFEEITGYGAGEVRGRNARFLQGTDRDQPALDGLRAAMREGRSWSGILLNYRKDGAPFRQEHALIPVLGEDGGTTHHVSVFYDVTDREEAEAKVRAAEAKYRALVENTPVMIYTEVVGESSTTMYTSPQAQTILGYPPTLEVSEDYEFWKSRIHPEDLDRVLAEDLRTNETGDTYEQEYRMLTAAGDYIWVHDKAVLVSRDEEGKLYWQGVMLDITDRKELEERLAHQALHDPLTGLPNRRLFTDRLEQATARTSRTEETIAVLFLDLDGFKRVNDSLGHGAGDALLIAVASRLKECLRPGDTVSRLGGDEFVVLLEGISGTVEAQEVAARIAHALRVPFDVDDRTLYVTASIGIATSAPGSSEPTNLLREADMAMYRAKSQGKARHEVSEQSHEEASPRHP